MYRVCFLYSENFPSFSNETFQKRLSKSLEKAVDRGYYHFLCGFDGEADCVYASLVLALKKEHSSILLEAFLPYYDEHLFSLSPYCDLLAQCDQITFLCDKPEAAGRERRDLAMLRRCQLVLIAFDSMEEPNFQLKETLLDMDHFLEVL